MIVARPGHAYPSVRLVAADLVNLRVGSLEPGTRVADALALATRLDLAVLAGAARSRRFVLREDLRRAVSLGLGDLAADRLARPAPVVDETASEIVVRRQLAHGAPMVVVRAGATIAGAVGTLAASPSAGSSLGGRCSATLTPALRSLLSRIGALAEFQGGRAFAVGGVVRDLLLGEGGRRERDVDVAVEGDGLSVARLLAAELGATLVEHPRFLTASVQHGSGQRVDIATARAEHYAQPGALPRVRPAPLGEDLRRRDFTVNAMAAELSSGAVHLIDPAGGRGDLQRRWLRILHPLAFVEDPTRVFRAARYGVRLGFSVEPWTAGCLELALALAPFPALSGQRMVAELELILREPRAMAALATLGAVGAFRLFDRGVQYTPATERRIGELDAVNGWAHAHGLAISGVETLLIAVLGDQDPDVARRALRQLGYSGRAAGALAGAGEGAACLGEALRATSGSAQARVLRGRTAMELAGLWLAGDSAVRSAVTRFLARDRAVAAWLDGDEVVALGIARGPQVARVLEELRDGRLEGTIADRAAAEDHVRRRAGGGGVTSAPETASQREEE